MKIPDPQKQFRNIFLSTAILLLTPLSLSPHSDRATLTGKVTDAAGHPLDHATVIVDEAGVLKGYSIFCPSCYTDCGKRTITDASGNFTFASLSPDLWFKLLVVRDGYEPAFITKADPSTGAAVSVSLQRHIVVDDPQRIFRGRVLNSQGTPLRDAVVQPIGTLDSKGQSVWGEPWGIPPVAITNEKGEFELDSRDPAQKIFVSADGQRMATTYARIPVGPQFHDITMIEGATIRGRLIQNGKPVGDAEIALAGRPSAQYRINLEVSGNPTREISIGSQPDGTFVFTNVPAPAGWYLFGKMESIASRGTTGVSELATKSDKELIDVGDLEIKPGYRLRGKVILSDGKQIPDGMRVTISSVNMLEAQTVMLRPDGQFEFVGLAAGDYTAWASVKGYAPPKSEVTGKPLSIDRNVDDFVLTLNPEKKN